MTGTGAAIAAGATVATGAPKKGVPKAGPTALLRAIATGAVPGNG